MQPRIRRKEMSSLAGLHNFVAGSVSTTVQNSHVLLCGRRIGQDPMSLLPRESWLWQEREAPRTLNHYVYSLLKKGKVVMVQATESYVAHRPKQR